MPENQGRDGGWGDFVEGYEHMTMGVQVRRWLLEYWREGLGGDGE